MVDHNSELAVRMADEWLEKNRKTDTWRLVNMLRDELVRSQDRVGRTPAVTSQGPLSEAYEDRDSIDPEISALFSHKIDFGSLEPGFSTVTPHQLIMGDPVYYGKKAASEAAAARRDVDAEARMWYLQLKDPELKKILDDASGHKLTAAYLEWWSAYTKGIQEAPTNQNSRGVSEEDASVAGAKAKDAVIALLS